MPNWIWQSDSESDDHDRFLVEGPKDGADIMKRWGNLFPFDAVAKVWKADASVEAVPWGLVPGIRLMAGERLELPGIPVAAGPLLYIIDRLLGPDGCPWDREQTPASLLHYLLDESYEACEALAGEDWPGFEDELGDVLLQVAFHGALLAHSSFDKIVGGQVAKLIRRHPHVFSGATVDTSIGVREQWDALKKHDPPRTSHAEWVYPALVLAKRLGKRGIVPRTPVFQAMKECLEVYVGQQSGKIEETLADAGWAVADFGRSHHVDVEWALWQRMVRMQLAGSVEEL